MSFKGYLDKLKGKRVFVLGAGISNCPLIEALLLAGIDTTVCDRRSRDELGAQAGRFERLGAVLRLGEGYLDNLNADVIFRTPGIMPWRHSIAEAVKNGAVLTSEMEAFFEVCPCIKIGVTGSDGKTTTTSFIAQLLKNEGLRVHVGGNIGNPLLCTADDMAANDVAVLELSSFQLISMKESPEIAIVTNLSPNHLDVHKDMDEYIAAKRNIFSWQTKSDVAVFNLDYDLTRKYSEQAPGEVRFFSRLCIAGNGVYTDGETIFDVHGTTKNEIMKVSEILLPGMHNVENIMAAFAALRGLVSYDIMRDTARTFSGVAHRIEFVREIDGVKYYNDSIASSPTRTIAGLNAFDQKLILIAGGKDKGIEFDELGAEVLMHVKTLVLTGLTAQRIKSVVENTIGYAGTPEIIVRDDFRQAVLFAAQSACRGDIVMLSPACTSFDRFLNFEERGNYFKGIINGL